MLCQDKNAQARKKKDLSQDGFRDSDRRMLRDVLKAACYGKMPTDKRRAGEIRRMQAELGVSLYKPSSKFAKGFSLRKAAEKAIDDSRFKDVPGAYKMAEIGSLAKAIARKYKAQKENSGT